jgi:capsular polysaccharide biosynthesis protein
MKNIIKDKVFWIFFLLVAGFVFVSSVNINKTYQAKSRILFLPKNEAATRNIGQIVENARQIPLSLTFYNKILELNGDIEDGALELPDAKRKTFWNGKIETQQVGKSGVVEITIFDANQMQAEIISRQTVAGVLTVMGNYYDTNNALNMKVIDGPISSETSRVNYLEAILASLAGGILSGALISFLINLLAGAVDRRILDGSKAGDSEEKISRPSIFPKFSFPEMVRKNFTETAEKRKVFDFKVEDEAALVPSKGFNFFGMRGKKAAAPSNLPIAEDFDMKVAVPADATSENDLKDQMKSDNIREEKDEFVLDMGGALGSSPASVPEIQVGADHKREATPEEVKMRLNKLLGSK